MSARALAVVRAALVWAASALVFAVATLAFVVSFEAISAFAVQVGAFPHALRYCAPLLVDSFTAAATLVILWISLTGDKIATAWDAWYAWALIGAATCVSVAINVAHAPDSDAARLVAALPPVALVLAVELLMILARRCLAQSGTLQAQPNRIRAQFLRRLVIRRHTLPHSPTARVHTMCGRRSPPWSPRSVLAPGRASPATRSPPSSASRNAARRSCSASSAPTTAKPLATATDPGKEGSNGEAVAHPRGGGGGARHLPQQAL